MVSLLSTMPPVPKIADRNKTEVAYIPDTPILVEKQGTPFTGQTINK